ncbi:hypothetical protein [Mesorhizobium sp. BH1-1-4]|uniref:hypothetical protein n=1 Tax=Mesorhizobium sp. BH1-1-4 TaxID=2876662 RepID=UPI001CD0DAA0|nr:hypothetical protein [Mesorhizobium sp. BH1-1-4]MBZ9994034.1 hypothetical protein [Mesorhizobium sp. BH1-1-4]
MAAPKNFPLRQLTLEDYISGFWILFFCLHIGIVVLYRFNTVDGKYILLPYQLPIACFHVLNCFLSPLISIVVFYVLNTKIEGLHSSRKIVWFTFFLTLLSNLLFTYYVLSPYFYPVLEGDTLIQRYSEATTLVGMANVAVLGPLSAIVYSGNK